MRCEGWRRHGGVFTLGPVRWTQCEKDAVVILRVKQEKISKQPACLGCWNEGVERGIKILSAKPIEKGKQ